MSGAAITVNWSAPLSILGNGASRGYGLCPSTVDTGRFVVATTANLALAGGHLSGICLDNGAAGASVRILVVGELDRDILGAGTATTIGLDSNGLLVRDPSGTAYGRVNALGDAHFNATGIASSSAASGRLTVAMADSNQTITSAANVFNSVLFTGTNTAIRTATVPDVDESGQPYIRTFTADAGSHGVAVQTASGSDAILVPPHTSILAEVDSNGVRALTDPSRLNLIPDLTDSTTRATNTARLQAAIDGSVDADGQSGGYRTLYALRIPPRKFYFDSTGIRITRRIMLLGGVGGFESASTQLYFPAATTAFTTTFNDQTYTGDSSWTEMRGITIRAEGKTAAAHGVMVHSTIRMYNCNVYGFEGDGVRVDAGTDVPNPGDHTAANFCHFEGCRFSSNGGYGLNVNLGSDNSGHTIVNCDFTSNDTGNLRDSSFLGITMLGGGLNNDDFSPPTARQLDATEVNARGTYVGVYAESVSGSRVPRIDYPSVVVGGILAEQCLAVAANTGVIISGAGCRWLFGYHPTTGLYTWGLGYQQYTSLALRDNLESHVSGLTLSSAMTGGGWRAGWHAWCTNLQSTAVAYAVSGEQASCGPGQMFTPNGLVVGTIGVGRINNQDVGIRICARDAAPTSSDTLQALWQKGDIIYNTSTTTGDPVMWRCTTGGAFSAHSLVGTWAAATSYNCGDIVEPTTPNGRVYRVKSISAAATGLSGNSEPTWPASGFDHTVTDGSGGTQITWQDVGSNTPVFTAMFTQP